MNKKQEFHPGKIVKRTFKPKGKNQREYIRDIAENDLVFCCGPAGSGKSACSVGMSVDYLCREEIDRIIITRPTVGTDEDGIDKGIGFLPGSMREKMDPYLRPIFDELSTYWDKHDIEYMIVEGIIEIAPLFYCRGRSFHRSFIIADEMQNASFNQLKMFCTRLGVKSKMVINGDIDQFDKKLDKCSLEIWIKEVINDTEGVGISILEKSDIVRHKLVSRILSQVENYEINK